MTMEVILSTAFGRAVDVQGGNGGKIYEAAMEVLKALEPNSGSKLSNFLNIVHGKKNVLHVTSVSVRTCQLMVVYELESIPFFFFVRNLFVLKIV